MSLHRHDHDTRTGLADGGPPRRGGAELKRATRDRWTTRVLRAGPVVTAIAWLAFFVVQFGPTGRGDSVGRALFITFGISAAFAFASGAYEHTRLFTWLRSRLARRRIDWEAFDAARAGWERRRR